MPSDNDLLKTIDLSLRALVKQPKICIGYQQLTVTNGVAVTLTPTTGAIYCEIRSETSAAGVSARYRMDGTAPTTSVGMPLTNLDLFDNEAATNIANFKAIATTATDVTLNIQYYK